MSTLAHPLGLPVAGGFVGFAVAHRHWYVLAFSVAGFLLTVKARRAGNTGVLLRPGEQPELFALVGEVARRVGVDRPIVVRLIPVPEVGVSTIGARGRRRSVLYLGWPYLRLLPARQLAAILAHEFGHELHAPGVATRRMLAARAALLGSLDRSVHVPRALAAPLLARSRQCAFDVELAADATAATVVGTGACRDALVVSDRLMATFEPFAELHLPRLAESGRVAVDLYAAHADAFSDPLVAESVRGMVEVLDAYPANPTLTHPVTAERVAALPRVTVADPPGDPDRPVPVRDADRLDGRCTADLLDRDPEGLTPVRLLDLDPAWFDPPVGEALSELDSAVREVTGRGGCNAALDAALDAVDSGAWPDVAARLEPLPAHVPGPAVRLARRDTYATCLGIVLAERLLAAGYQRVSRWTCARLRAPDGSLLDLRGLVYRALDDADTGPLRALLDAPGRRPGTLAAS